MCVNSTKTTSVFLNFYLLSFVVIYVTFKKSRTRLWITIHYSSEKLCTSVWQFWKLLTLHLQLKKTCIVIYFKLEIFIFRRSTQPVCLMFIWIPRGLCIIYLYRAQKTNANHCFIDLISPIVQYDSYHMYNMLLFTAFAP